MTIFEQLHTHTHTYAVIRVNSASCIHCVDSWKVSGWSEPDRENSPYSRENGWEQRNNDRHFGCMLNKPEQLIYTLHLCCLIISWAKTFNAWFCSHEVFPFLLFVCRFGDDIWHLRATRGKLGDFQMCICDQYMRFSCTARRVFWTANRIRMNFWCTCVCICFGKSAKVFWFDRMKSEAAQFLAVGICVSQCVKPKDIS